MPDKKNVPNEANRKNRIKQFLIRQCYSSEVAEIFAESLAKFDTPFFTKSVEFRLDQEDGFSMDVDFVNFIQLPQNLAPK